MNKKCTFIRISLKSVPKCSIDNKSALVKVMSWIKPLTEPMMPQFTDAYMPLLGGDELKRLGLGWNTSNSLLEK